MIDRAIDRAVSLLAMIVAPLAVRLVPLPVLLRIADRIPAGRRAAATPDGLGARVSRWLRWGIGPWKSTCLTRATVLYALLRYHGFRPQFYIGVRGAHEAFGAHAWVTLGGRTVSDPGGVSGYTSLMSHGE